MKDYDEKFKGVFLEEWYMEQLIAWEFCRQTKLHLDEILSKSHYSIEVSKLIEILQATIDFETDLQNKFEQNKLQDLMEFDRKVAFGNDGKVEIESGSAKEIAAKYKQVESDKNDDKQKYFKREAKDSKR